MFRKSLNNTTSWNSYRKAPEGESGGEGGGAGAAGAGNASGESSPSSAPSGGGGIQQAAFDHGPSGEQFSPADVNSRVGEIMKLPGDSRLTAQQLSDMLSFNIPFTPAEKKEGAETTPPAATTPPAGTSPPTPAAAAKPPAETPPPAATPLTAEALAAAIAKATQPAPAATPTPGAETPPAPKPFYGDTSAGSMKPPMQVNPELAAAIFGDKPEVAQQALNIMVNGIMNQLMTDSSQLMGMMYNKIVTDVRGIIPAQITHQTESRNNTERFYSKFQELSVPTIKPLIESVAAAMRKAEPNTNPGSDDFLNRLGLAVHAAWKQEFGFDLPRKGAAPLAAPANTPQRKEPFVSNGGARPPAAANGHDKSADILSLLI